MTNEQKIKSQGVEINKLSKRVMVAEQRVAELEDGQLFLEQEQGWQQESLDELEKSIKRLQQSINTIELEKMIFDPD